MIHFSLGVKILAGLNMYIYIYPLFIRGCHCGEWLKTKGLIMLDLHSLYEVLGAQWPVREALTVEWPSCEVSREVLLGTSPHS